MEQKEGHCGSFFSGLLKQVAKVVKSKANDSSKPAEPKQGHHIINKGVINIYEEIIGQFVRDHKYNYIFKGKSYEELKATKMMIDDRAKEALGFLFGNNPLSREATDYIKATTVFINNRGYKSTNDKGFSTAKLALIFCVNEVMFTIYDLLNEEGVNSRDPRFKSHLQQLEDVITENFFPSPSKCAYVDCLAWEWRKKEKGDSEVSKFNECKNEVKEMLENIVKCEKQVDENTIDVTPLVFRWGKGAFSVSKALSSTPSPK